MAEVDWIKRPNLENSRNYMQQLCFRETVCKHQAIRLERRHSFSGFRATVIIRRLIENQLFMYLLAHLL
jgi:hypothetical protein